jgi:chromosome segregation ATPase
MRPKSYSDEDVIQAANDLMVEGKAINGTSLRKKIGSGRASTLQADYNRLKEVGEISALAVVEEAPAPLVHQELPPEIDERLKVFQADFEETVQAINDHAHHVVESRLNSAIAEANERASQAAQREAESLEEQAKAFDEVEDIRDELEELKEQLKTAQQNNQTLCSDLEISRLETKAALEDVEEAKEVQGRLEESLEKYRINVQNAESRAAQAEGGAIELRQQLSAASDDNAALAEEKQSLSELLGIEKTNNMRLSHDFEVNKTLLEESVENLEQHKKKYEDAQLAFTKSDTERELVASQLEIKTTELTKSQKEANQWEAKYHMLVSDHEALKQHHENEPPKQ